MEYKTFLIHDELLSKKKQKQFSEFAHYRIEFMSGKELVDLWNKFAKSPDEVLIIEQKQKSTGRQ